MHGILIQNEGNIIIDQQIGGSAKRPTLYYFKNKQWHRSRENNERK